MEKIYFYLLFTGVCIVKCTITIDEEPKGNQMHCASHTLLTFETEC